MSGAISSMSLTMPSKENIINSVEMFQVYQSKVTTVI